MNRRNFLKLPVALSLMGCAAATAKAFTPELSIADRIEAGERFHDQKLVLDRPLELRGCIDTVNCDISFNCDCPSYMVRSHPESSGTFSFNHLRNPNNGSPVFAHTYIYKCVQNSITS